MPTNANNGFMQVMVITKALVCVMLVGTACYCQIMQIPLDGITEKIILGVLGVYFGMSAMVYREHQRNTTKVRKG